MSATLCLLLVTSLCAVGPSNSPHPIRHTFNTDAEIDAFVQGAAVTERFAFRALRLAADSEITMEGVRSLKSLTPRRGLNVSVWIDCRRTLSPDEIVMIADTPAITSLSLADPQDWMLATLGSSGSHMPHVTVTAVSVTAPTTLDGVTCLANLKNLRKLFVLIERFPSSQAWKLGAFNACPKLATVAIRIPRLHAHGDAASFDAIRAHLPSVDTLAVLTGGDTLAQMGGPGGTLTLTSNGRRTTLREADPSKARNPLPRTR